MHHTLVRIWVLIVGFSLSACVPMTADMGINRSYEVAWMNSEYAPYARDIFGFGGGGGHVYFDYSHGFTYHIRDHHGRVLAHAVRRPGGHYLIVNDHDRILFHLLFAGGGRYRIEDPLGYHYGFLDYYDVGHFALLDHRRHALSTVWFQPLYFGAPNRRLNHHRHNPKHQIRDAQPMATAPPATMHHPRQQKKRIAPERRDQPAVRYQVKPRAPRHVKQPRSPQQKFTSRPSRDHPVGNLRAIKQLRSHDAAKSQPKKTVNRNFKPARPSQKADELIIERMNIRRDQRAKDPARHKIVKKSKSKKPESKKSESKKTESTKSKSKKAQAKKSDKPHKHPRRDRDRQKNQNRH